MKTRLHVVHRIVREVPGGKGRRAVMTLAVNTGRSYDRKGKR